MLSMNFSIFASTKLSPNMKYALRALLAAIGLCASIGASAQMPTITNDTFWTTTSGEPIYSQGGGIFRFPNPATGRECYFWYGVHYRGAETYRERPVEKNDDTRFMGVTCYTSDDLVHWTSLGHVLTPEAAGRAGWMGRMGVVYVKEKQLYALFIQQNSSVLVCTSESPAGPFQRHNSINMTPLIGTPNTGDQTVFTDADGRSYLVYSYGQGRSRIYVSEIGVGSDGRIGLTDCTEVFRGAGREGNCMFRHAGKYYLCASDLYGWNASNVYYLVADSVRGPYRPAGTMEKMAYAAADYGHVTQTGFFVTIDGSSRQTVVYCGDRWADFAGNGNGYNQWVPISFVDDIPHFNSLSQWQLDATTGLWQPGPQNNYAKNGSFEADRVSIPSAKKPVQDFLTGWQTEVIKGHAIAVGSKESPVLNAPNSPAERAEGLVGNFSMCVSDDIDFSRRISQLVGPTEFVPLPAGRYVMRAKAQLQGRFSCRKMYATSGGHTFHTDLGRADGQWHTVQLPNILVRADGHVELGFELTGKAGACCRIDDVEFVRVGE